MNGLITFGYAGIIYTPILDPFIDICAVNAPEVEEARRRREAAEREARRREAEERDQLRRDEERIGIDRSPTPEGPDLQEAYGELREINFALRRELLHSYDYQRDEKGRLDRFIESQNVNIDKYIRRIIELENKLSR